LQESGQQPRVSGSVNSGHKDGSELLICWGLISGHSLLPEIQVQSGGVVEVVVQVGREEGLRNLGNELVEFLAVFHSDAATHRPHKGEDVKLFKLDDVLRRVRLGVG